MAMPRYKTETRRDADAETIRDFFDRAMDLKAQQKAKSGDITALNYQMSDAGVDPGVLSLFYRIASMPEAKAALYLTLIDYYKGALASRLPNPLVQAAERPEERAKAEARPFVPARGAAAA
jgi:hypothetical protein